MTDRPTEANRRILEVYLHVHPLFPYGYQY